MFNKFSFHLTVREMMSSTTPAPPPPAPLVKKKKQSGRMGRLLLIVLPLSVGLGVLIYYIWKRKSGAATATTTAAAKTKTTTSAAEAKKAEGKGLSAGGVAGIFVALLAAGYFASVAYHYRQDMKLIKSDQARENMFANVRKGSHYIENLGWKVLGKSLLRSIGLGANTEERMQSYWRHVKKKEGEERKD
jgi:uncharacterized protein HemX